MLRLDKYEAVGLYIGVLGAILSFYGFFFLYNPIIQAGGIALIIIGMTVTLTVPDRLSAETISLLINDSIANTEAMIRDLRISSKAVYYTDIGRQILAFVPVSQIEKVPTLEALRQNPPMLISKVGEQYGLTFIPFGSKIVKEEKIERDDDFELALRRILIEDTNLVESSRVAIEPDGVSLELVAPAFDPYFENTNQVLGSPLAQVCCSIFAACTGGQIVVENEIKKGKKRYISLRTVGS